MESKLDGLINLQLTTSINQGGNKILPGGRASTREHIFPKKIAWEIVIDAIQIDFDPETHILQVCGKKVADLKSRVGEMLDIYKTKRQVYKARIVLLKKKKRRRKKGGLGWRGRKKVRKPLPPPRPSIRERSPSITRGEGLESPIIVTDCRCPRCQNNKVLRRTVDRTGRAYRLLERSCRNL